MAPTFKLVARAPKADLFVVPVFSDRELDGPAATCTSAIAGPSTEASCTMLDST